MLAYLRSDTLKTSFRCLLISILSAALISISTSVFLLALHWVTEIREARHWIVFFLPFAGLLIAWVYSEYGKGVEKGNNLIIEEFHDPKLPIPFKMTPLIFFSTILTHLAGGSTGREGVAVQMGGSISDQFSRYFKSGYDERRTTLVIGMSAGFASVFGTPFAAVIFALEVLPAGENWRRSLLPGLIAALVAHQLTLLLGIHHAQYNITSVPEFNAMHLVYVLLAGVTFGLTAMLFKKTLITFTDISVKFIPNLLLRTMAGGAVIMFAIILSDAYEYTGLGLQVIEDAFKQTQGLQVFLLKIVFTTFALGVGFKGGEVTPLFFIGATLGSALNWIMPLPVSFLAALGFVAVFAGAANTPLACIVMSMELFGIQPLAYFCIVCLTSYFFSGTKGIYSSQKPGPILHFFRNHLRRAR